MSTWFAAHVVMYVEFKEGEQTGFPVWENVVLVEAESEEEAFRKAEHKGQEAAGDDGGTFRWGGKRASWVFGGIRKLTLCEDEDERPGDGTEITYLEFRLRSKAALEKLLRSEKVSLELNDSFPEPPQPQDITIEQEPRSIHFLGTREQAWNYLQDHARQIRRAVIVPHAILFFSDNGEPRQEVETGMILHMSDGRVRFLARDTAESFLNEGLFIQMNIRVELPR